MINVKDKHNEFIRQASSLINSMKTWVYLDAIHEGLAATKGLLMFIMDAKDDLKFVLVSPEWERLTGWETEDMIGKNYKDFVHPDDLPSTDIAATEFIKEGADQTGYQNRYKTKNGDYIELTWLRGSMENSQRYIITFALPTKYLKTLIE